MSTVAKNKITRKKPCNVTYNLSVVRIIDGQQCRVRPLAMAVEKQTHVGQLLYSALIGTHSKLRKYQIKL